MVTVQLKHVHIVRTKLRSGRTVEYHYAWKGKGAPRLEGAPGSPVYVAGYEAAFRARRGGVGQGTVKALIVAFRASPEFKRLGAHTLRAYHRHLDQIDAEFGDMELAALEEARVRRHFIRWRNTMAETPRTADYAVGTLKRLLAWAVENVLIETNQAEPITRLHAADKSDDIWEEADFGRFATTASRELRWAVELASFTGLRQGDLIRLRWSDYNGSSFVLRTSKRGKAVLIPATQACRVLVAQMAEARDVRRAAAARAKRGQVADIVAERAAQRAADVILVTERGARPWTADGLRSSFGKACKGAGVVRTFHDLRRTAATRLLMAGLDDSTVALLMGWEERAVTALKRKYVSRVAVAAAVVERLERTHAEMDTTR